MEVRGVWITSQDVTREVVEMMRPVLEAATRQGVTQIITDRFSWRYHRIDEAPAVLVVNDLGELEVMPG